MKDLMKVQNHGRFHHYSCGCRVKNFQNFAYRISIHAEPIFEGVLGPYSPKYGSVLLKFEELSRKFREFSRKRDVPKVCFWHNFEPPLPPER